MLVGIVSWFSQKAWLRLIKASKEVNNFIPPPKDLGVFLSVVEVKGGLFAESSIEGLSEEFEGVHGYSRIRRFKKHQFKGYFESGGVFDIGVKELDFNFKELL